MNKSLPPLPPRPNRNGGGLPPLDPRVARPTEGLPPIPAPARIERDLTAPLRRGSEPPPPPPIDLDARRRERRRRGGLLVASLVVLTSAVAGAVSARVFGPEPKETASSQGAANTPVTSIADAAEILTSAVNRAAPSVVEVRTPFGQGSGVIVQPQGLVVTNNHVIEGNDRVEVITSSGASIVANVVSADPNQDLAILRPVSNPGIGIELADDVAGPPPVGATVFAIGSPFGLQNTVTKGIVSAIREQNGIPLIQFDAPVNPGNSGGGLFDLDGRLVGIPTSIQSPIQGNVGLGFAVPASRVRQMIAQVR